ncbi:radical SAM protein [Mycobacterium sp. SMC-4]|uniref:radical SAM protein n=1 Tax=Mycobacterium sp. SMC-4 TaxID=2857059 RepID=UPI0021B4D212|nr:radical SAM protein [Mycobacterium sp. SMC-4]UXA17726.1 radical SAM protein [Mycobacterium sp. SMC-4]
MTTVASAQRHNAGPDDAVTIAQIVLKVVSACNLDCSYCYVYHAKDNGYRERPGLLSDELIGLLITRINEYGAVRPHHRMGVCLHGGEPLLMGPERLRSLVERLRSEAGPALGSLNVQTNATLIDREWAKLLKELRISVSVSLDGPPDINDVARVDHMGRGSATRTEAGIRHLMDAGVHVAVLSVVRPGENGAETYHYLRSLGVTDFDFLLPDVTHDDWRTQFGTYGPTPVADYLLPALTAWLAENDPSVSVRLFADMFRLILGDSGGTDAFGGGPMHYAIVESDGSIQANDALRVCEATLNHTGLNIATHGFDDLRHSSPLARALFEGAIPPPRKCGTCPELLTCGGGYMPHRYSREHGFDNPSVWCADIVKLFGHMRAVVRADSARSPAVEAGGT